MILTLTYGKTTPTTFEDPDLQDMIRDVNRFRMVIPPGAYLVDTFPVLQWFPGYLSELRIWHRDSLELFRRCLSSVQTRIVGVFNIYLLWKILICVLGRWGGRS